MSFSEDDDDDDDPFCDSTSRFNPEGDLHVVTSTAPADAAAATVGVL